MKNILCIGTGGTIASELVSDGLAPELNAEQLLHYVPQIREFCCPTCLQIFSIDSTNMSPSRWLQMAACIREHYDEYDGFVITHGTDTMAYSAAALSYLIQQCPKPIILTGAQKPIGSDNTDSKINLEDAFRCACSPLRGVMVVFNGKVIRGTRARKTHSKSFRAFSSINYPELAYIQDGHVFSFIRPEHGGIPLFSERLNERVALLKMIPGTDSRLLEARDADGALRLVMLVDVADSGLSAVYTFFDPERPKDSLGTWGILRQIALCQQLGLPYLYLGYWIANSAKMAYKNRFSALQYFDASRWHDSPPPCLTT